MKKKKKKKKAHGKGWASLPIDKMLKGAFQGIRGRKKTIYTKRKDIFKEVRGALDSSRPPPSTSVYRTHMWVFVDPTDPMVN
jgi:hypothetical protein